MFWVRADAERLSAMSARFCPDPKEAIVCARTLYFMQIIDKAHPDGATQVG